VALRLSQHCASAKAAAPLTADEPAPNPRVPGAHGGPERARLAAPGAARDGVGGLPEEGVVGVAPEAAVEVEAAADARVALGQQRADLREAEFAVHGGEVAEALAQAEDRVGPARADGGGSESVRAHVGVELVHGGNEVVREQGARERRARRARLPRHRRARVARRGAAEGQEEGGEANVEGGVAMVRNGTKPGPRVARSAGTRQLDKRRVGKSLQ
jgi:hypothetical protein